MRIWVDADACPKPIKDILFRAAIRTKTEIILVANQLLSTPASPFIKRVQVSSGFDKADHYIADHIEASDLVITADIPLADRVVTQLGIALNPRGTLYTEKNIKQSLSMRNFADSMRSSGLMSGGPAAMSKKEIQAFANELDRILAKK